MDVQPASGIERMALRTRSELPLPVAVKGIRESVLIHGIARFGSAGAGDLCFCDREPDWESLTVMTGTIILCSQRLEQRLVMHFPNAVVVPLPDPRAMFIDFCHAMDQAANIEVSSRIPRPFGVHPSASIGDGCIIHAETRIDERVLIGANCVIKRGTWIKADSVIHDNTVIGASGINAYRGQDEKMRRFPHLAGVMIGERTEIGAGGVVVRGIVNSTSIGRDCVIGNLCNIGHAADLGDQVWMSVGCLIGGHSAIGTGATIGMGARLRDNIQVGPRSQIGMGSVVTKSVPADVSVFGVPARVVPAITAGPER